MTREEEINQAAENNIDVSIYTPKDGEMLKETFYIGAKWADKHPNLERLWHDASIRPKDNSEILVNWNIKGHSGYESYYTCAIENWDRFIEGYGVSKWAYVNDLLPKQFGISEQLKGGEK